MIIWLGEELAHQTARSLDKQECRRLQFDAVHIMPIGKRPAWLTSVVISLLPGRELDLSPSSDKLLRIVLRLWHRIRTIKEKSYNLLEYFFSSVHRAVDPIARLRPIHFAHSDLA
jgi:hypothetical protein